MRVLAQFEDQRKARLFSTYLRKEGIENTCEIVLDPDKKEVVCTLWVHDEDDISQAKAHLEEFKANPPQEQNAESPQKEKHFSIKNPQYDLPKQKAIPLITYFFLAACVFIYFLNLMQENAIAAKDGSRVVAVTPVQSALLYDEPTVLLFLEKAFQKNPVAHSENPENYPQELKNALQQSAEIPAFRGFYPHLVSYLSKNVPKPASGPMFVKIKEGELWRLFTPAILHRDLLHILFNMLWLIFLGKQLEERVSKLRLILFVLIVGVISNTAQYLMSGPNFLGFSGVITGMVGFIWIRKKIAPWEGYPLHNSTLLFFSFFLIGLLVLQIIIAFLQISGSSRFMFNIANTAHFSGAFAGALLAKVPFFRWKG